MPSIGLPINSAYTTEKDHAVGKEYLRDSLGRAQVAGEIARLQNAKEVLEGLAAEEGAPDCIGKAAEMLCDRACQVQLIPDTIE